MKIGASHGWFTNLSLLMALQEEDYRNWVATGLKETFFFSLILRKLMGSLKRIVYIKEENQRNGTMAII